MPYKPKPLWAVGNEHTSKDPKDIISRVLEARKLTERIENIVQSIKPGDSDSAERAWFYLFLHHLGEVQASLDWEIHALQALVAANKQEGPNI
jgi:hypothetical protein